MTAAKLVAGPEATRSGSPPGSGGLEGADHGFRVVLESTARLVRLLADELVPLSDATVADITVTVERIGVALPELAEWREGPVGVDWALEAPLTNIGIRLDTIDDLAVIDNVERLRRAFEFLDPTALALRKEAAIVVVDALLHHLRANHRLAAPAG